MPFLIIIIILVLGVFPAQALVTEESHNLTTFLHQNTLASAWEQDNKIVYTGQENILLPPTLSGLLEITGECLSSPYIILDEKDNLFLTCIAQKPTTNQSRIIFSRLPTFEPVTIFESMDALRNLVIKQDENTILVAWQKFYGTRDENYFAYSIDQGRHFTPPTLANDPGNNLVDLYLQGNKIYAIYFFNGKSVAQELAQIALPGISVENPQASTWFKSGSAILFSAKVLNQISSIEDGTAPEITLDGNALAHSLAYEADNKTIRGFFSLPDNLSNGKHFLNLRLCNLTTRETIQVDNTLPRVKTEPCFTTSPWQCKLPVFDEHSGIDPKGTIIKFGGISFEGSVTIEGNNLVCIPKYPFTEASLEVQVTPRDNAGNVGANTVLTLIYDPNYKANANSVGNNLIADFCQGPNPFNPVKNLPGAFATLGSGTVFSYALSQPADVRIRIYDITGTLIWCKDIPAATAGVTAWSGVDQFGNLSDNGIYPFFFSAAADGRNESRKGKIVIVR